MKIDQIKNIIQSAHLNFLIGSGVSRPYLNTLGGVETWLTELTNNPSEDEVKDLIAKCSIVNEYLTGVIAPNLEETKTELEKIYENWEDYELGHAEAEPDEQQQRAINYHNTKSTYQDFLTLLHSLLACRNTNLHGKTVNLFTTNIDMLVESSANGLGVEFNDGFTGRKPAVFAESNFSKQATKVGVHLLKSSEIPTINYIKLHGSINWAKADNDSVIADDALKNVQAIKTTFESVNQYFISISKVEKEYKETDEDKRQKSFVDFLRTEISYDLEKKEEIHDALTQAWQEYRKIIMINPTKQKFRETVMDLPFYELMRLYSNALERNNSILFVAGFSFADEHLTKITLRAAASNPTLAIIVFAYSEDSKTEILRSFSKQGTIANNNIFVLTPSEFTKSNSGENIGKIEIRDLNKLETFTLSSINRYVLSPIINSVV